MCRVDPQAGEPGPCIVRARGAREHGKDAPPSSLLTGAFRPLAPSLMTNLRGTEIPNPLSSKGEFIVRGGLPGLGGLFSCNHDDRQGVQESERRGHGSTSRARCVSRPLVADTSRHGVKTTVNTTPLSTATTPPLFSLRSSRLSLLFHLLLLRRLLRLLRRLLRPLCGPLRTFR